jgi:hypothetical protein
VTRAPAPWELIIEARPELAIEADGRLAGADGAELLGRRLTEARAALSPIVRDTRRTDRADPAGRYFRVRGPEEPDGDLDVLADDLLETPVVESAFLKRPAATPVLPPPAVGFRGPAAGPEPAGDPDDFRIRQAYLDPAPGGIGAEAAWERPGGRGEGVRLVDVEAAWNFAHEDLQVNPGGVLAGTPPADQEWRNHGTNVVGILGGDHNPRGVSGICPATQVRGVSFFSRDGGGTALAILRAARTLRPGDILLLEMMRPGPNAPDPHAPGFDEDDQTGYVALEYWPDDFAAIQWATRNGIVVVQAAGNGAQDLDDPAYRRGAERPSPFRRDELDSGAILVGAGAPPPGTNGADHGPDRAHLAFSNWGTAVDVQGWGREVTTTGGLGDGPDELRPGPVEDRWYTTRFSGTSSAAAIVAGTLACVQGILRAAGRHPLSPGEARTALRKTGHEQHHAGNGPQRSIGRRPDLAQLIPWALEHAPDADVPRQAPRRPSGMRVTITIDSDSLSIGSLPDRTDVTAVRGPYVKDDELRLPRQGGDELAVPLSKLEALAEKKD